LESRNQKQLNNLRIRFGQNRLNPKKRHK